MAPHPAEVLPEVDGLPAGGPGDKELALAFKSGEKGAYQAIYERHSSRVHSVCRRMLQNPDDAREAAQETFLKMYQALPRFNGRYQMGAWITRIATNVCLDTLRAKGRRPQDSVLVDEIEQDVVVDIDSDPELHFIRRSESRHVRKVLGTLPAMHRAAIVLRDFEGLSYDEVATALGITECQVKALIHRARKSFKRSWASSLASIFVPAGFLHRLRRATPAREHTSTVAHSSTNAAEFVSSSAQFAVSCSNVVHQCGQFMVDKIAPVLTAVAVGGAALGVAHAGPRDPLKDESPKSKVATANDEVKAARTTKDRRGNAHPRTEAPVTTASPAPAPVDPSEDDGDEPAPAPTATPGPSGPQPQPQPSSPPEPTGSQQAFGSDVAWAGPDCGCSRPTASSGSIAVDTGAMRSFRQSLSGTAVAAGTAAYPYELRHSATGDGHQMSFFLYTAEGSYGYRAEGSVVSRSDTPWGGWIYRYEGSYTNSSRPATLDGLPAAGTYVVEITVSWRQERILSTSIFLTEG